MYLDRTHIYNFIKQHFKIKTKEDIAKNILHFDASMLSPNRSYDPDYFYKCVFDISEDKKKEEDMLSSLKYFLQVNGLKDSLIDIWNNEYKDFIMTLLWRANKSPPTKKKSSSKKKNAPLLEKDKSNNVSQNKIEVVKQDTTRSQSEPIDAEILHNKDPLKRLLREVSPELKKRLATVMPIVQQLNKDDE